MGQQEIVRVAQGLCIEDVDGGMDPAPRDLSLERARRDQTGARGVHQQAARGHCREVFRGDQPACLGCQSDVEADDVGGREEVRAARRHLHSIRTGPGTALIRPPPLDPHTKGFGIPRNGLRDPSVAVEAKHAPPQGPPDAHLPLTCPNACNLFGKLSIAAEHQGKGQLCGRVVRPVGGHVRTKHDSTGCAGGHVHMGVGPTLRDQPEVRQSRQQVGTDLGALAEKHQRLGFIHTLGKAVRVRLMVRPDGYLMFPEFLETGEGPKRIEPIVEDMDLHLVQTDRGTMTSPRASSRAVRIRPAERNSIPVSVRS